MATRKQSCHQRAPSPVGLFFFLILVFIEFQEGNCSVLKVNFYAKTCPRAESVVQDAVSSAIFNDPTIAGSLLRLLFHDCFSQGCDASILLDSVNGQQAEKDEAPNRSLRGFDVISSIKGQVEAACPGVVSCSDIMAFAARDSVVQMGGQSWSVPAGRRDGRLYAASNSNVPSFSSSVPLLAKSFQAQGLTQSEMVTLSGAHTIGRAACSSFSYRLYNFNSTFAQDPTLDPSYAQALKSVCPNQGGPFNSADLDVATPTTFDNMYYKNLMSGRGLLQSDQSLSSYPGTRGNVRQLAGNNTVFLSKFAKAMAKMSAIGVQTGTLGQIRLNCSVANS